MGEPYYRPDLGKVSVLVKTFLRDQHLSRTVAGLLQNLPEAQIIVVDDGERSSESKFRLYERLSSMGHVVYWMPFDSGFGMKSNMGSSLCRRPYLLIASDDFDFFDPQARGGVEKMVVVLDKVPEVAIASGRVNGYRYEGWLKDFGDRIVEEYIDLNVAYSVLGVSYSPCNLTVNYSLIRRDILGPDKVHWDDDVKIGGGEHGAFFVDVMRAGHGVAYVHGVNIREHTEQLPADPRYHQFRGRARQPGRPCFKRRGIREYVMFGGGVETA